MRGKTLDAEEGGYVDGSASMRPPQNAGENHGSCPSRHP